MQIFLVFWGIFFANVKKRWNSHFCNIFWRLFLLSNWATTWNRWVSWFWERATIFRANQMSFSRKISNFLGDFKQSLFVKIILNDFIAFKLRNTKNVLTFFKIFLAKIRIDLFRSKQKHFEYRIPSYKDTQNFFSRKILTFLTSIMEPKILCLKSASRNLLANQLPL